MHVTVRDVHVAQANECYTICHSYRSTLGVGGIPVCSGIAVLN